MTITTSGTSVTYNDSTVQSTAWKGVNYQVITSTTTFTVPTGITSLVVTVLGAGGGGGSGWANGGNDPTGGWGGMCIAYISGLTSGASITATIGNGGAGARQLADPRLRGAADPGRSALPRGWRLALLRAPGNPRRHRLCPHAEPAGRRPGLRARPCSAPRDQGWTE